jgi:integrase
MKFQDPKIEVRGDGLREHWAIRAYVPVVQPDGRVTRVRKLYRLGLTRDLSKKQANAEKQRIMATVNGGSIVAAAQLPLASLIAKYRDARLPMLASTTQAKYGCHLERHIEPDLGTLRLAEIDRPTLEAWLVAKAQLSHATRLDLRNIVSSLFTAAIEWRMWPGANPAHGVNVGRGGAVRKFVKPTPADVLRFLDEIPDTHVLPAYRARVLAQVAIVAGLRVSECLGLQPQDVDYESQTLTVERRYARGDVDGVKTAASERTRCIGSLVEDVRLISKKVKPTGWIFAGPGGTPPDDRDLQQYVWRPAATAAGIYHAGFGLHSLRRLSATWRQELGATAIEAMQQMGHRSLRMTALYTLEDRGREAQVVSEMCARLGTNGYAETQREAVSC